MATLGEILKHPEYLIPIIKLKMSTRQAGKHTIHQPHLRFCYSILLKVSTSFSLIIPQLPIELRDAVCIFYLVLRALDTIEDDTSISMEVKVPILMAFHCHIYEKDWYFSCGKNHYKVLTEQFHHVSTAFLELPPSFQEIIKDTTMRMGAGMAKFISKEIETVDDYDEYCHYVAGLVGLGLSKLFHISGKEDLPPDHLANAMGVFVQKENIIKDYLEDINELPMPRMFWPRQIWSKYVNKLEDLKYEENSVKAAHCLNEMVTNALIHVEDCLTFMASLRDSSIFRFYAIFLNMVIGRLALCYNNLEVFKGNVQMRRGFIAQLIHHTKTMQDVYASFYHFSNILKSKVDLKDPNASKTLEQIEVILKISKGIWKNKH